MALNLKNLSDSELQTLLKAHGINFGVISTNAPQGGVQTGQGTMGSNLPSQNTLTDLGTPNSDQRSLKGSVMGQLESGQVPNQTYSRHFGWDRLSPAAVESRQIDNQVLQQMGSPEGGSYGDSPLNPSNGSEAYDMYRQTQGEGGATLDDYLPQSMRSRFGEAGSPMATQYGRDVYNMNMEGTLPGVPTSFKGGRPQGPGWENYGSPQNSVAGSVPDYRVPGQGIEFNALNNLGQHPLQVRQDTAPGRGIDFTQAQPSAAPQGPQTVRPGQDAGANAVAGNQTLFKRPDGSFVNRGTRDLSGINHNDIDFARSGPNDSPAMMQAKHNRNNQSRQDFWASKLGLDPAVEDMYFAGDRQAREGRMQQMATNGQRSSGGFGGNQGDTGGY